MNSTKIIASTAQRVLAFGIGAVGLLLPTAVCATEGTALTDLVIRRVQTELFTAQPSGLPGNDDAGSLSSWYVFSALGFYPMIPGVGGVALSSPVFSQATLQLQNGAKLEIIGRNASPQNCYVQSLKVNGQNWGSSWLPWKKVANGGTLEFTLGPEPSAWGTQADQLPPAHDAIQP